MRESIREYLWTWRDYIPSIKTNQKKVSQYGSLFNEEGNSLFNEEGNSLFNEAAEERNALITPGGKTFN